MPCGFGSLHICTLHHKITHRASAKLVFLPLSERIKPQKDMILQGKLISYQTSSSMSSVG